MALLVGILALVVIGMRLTRGPRRSDIVLGLGLILILIIVLTR